MDHFSLKWILNLADSAGSIACWPLRLSEFDFKVVRLARVTYQATAALISVQMTIENGISLEEDLLLRAIVAEGDHTSNLALNAISRDIVSLNAQEDNSICTPSPLMELVVGQALDNCRKAASLNIDHAESKVHINQRGRLVQKTTSTSRLKSGNQFCFELVISTRHLFPPS